VNSRGRTTGFIGTRVCLFVAVRSRRLITGELSFDRLQANRCRVESQFMGAKNAFRSKNQNKLRDFVGARNARNNGLVLV
jgi:hypothetical protein